MAHTAARDAEPLGRPPAANAVYAAGTAGATANAFQALQQLMRQHQRPPQQQQPPQQPPPQPSAAIAAPEASPPPGTAAAPPTTDHPLMGVVVAALSALVQPAGAQLQPQQQTQKIQLEPQPQVQHLISVLQALSSMQVAGATSAASGCSVAHPEEAGLGPGAGLDPEPEEDAEGAGWRRLLTLAMQIMQLVVAQQQQHPDCPALRQIGSDVSEAVLRCMMKQTQQRQQQQQQQQQQYFQHPHGAPAQMCSPARPPDEGRGAQGVLSLQRLLGALAARALSGPTAQPHPPLPEQLQQRVTPAPWMQPRGGEVGGDGAAGLKWMPSAVAHGLVIPVEVSAAAAASALTFAQPPAPTFIALLVCFALMPLAAFAALPPPPCLLAALW